MAIEQLPGQMSLWSDQQPKAVLPNAPPDEDPSEQWFFQYHEHLLLTVQAVHRLRQAFLGKML
jgi:hypothetical protein